MSCKLTDEERKQIIADRASGMTYKALAGKYGVAQNTIFQIVKKGPELREECEKKHRETCKDIFEYMDSRKEKAISVLDLAFESLQNPEKYQRASVQSIATMIGIILDKYTQLAQLSKSGGISNELLESLLTLEREAKRNGN